MRTPNVRAFLGRHTTAAQAGLALVAAAGLAWSDAGVALADLSLPESLPVTCASGPVGDMSAVTDLSPIADLSAVTDCSPVAEVSSPVADDPDDGDSDDADASDGHHGCQFDNDKDLTDDRTDDRGEDRGEDRDKDRGGDDRGGDDHGSRRHGGDDRS